MNLDQLSTIELEPTVKTWISPTFALLSFKETLSGSSGGAETDGAWTS